MSEDYVSPGPSREAIDASQGPMLLEFGAGWCGHCQAASPIIAGMLVNFPSVQHIKVEDGPGRPLGRSFRVKLWPSLIFLNDGVEVTRLVRPTKPEDVQAALTQIC